MTTFSVTIEGGPTFEAADDRTVLESALRAGQWMAHACSQGTCGTCKFSLAAGTVDHGQSCDVILTPEDRAAGKALACQSRPRGDLTVMTQGGGDGPAVTHPLRDHTGVIRELVPIATDTVRLVVDLEGPLSFSAGQYCEISVPGTGLWRQYSMANTPAEDTRLEFHIKRVCGGAATDEWIFRDLAPGDHVDLRGPMGGFMLDGPREESAILIGGGTGLAPLKSIARHALENDLLPQITLYHGCRTQDDLYDVDFFRDLEARHPNFSYVPVLSEGQWDGASGLVTDVVLESFSSCRDHAAFMCGPPQMIQAGVKALRRRRMPSRLMFKEEFTPASPGPEAMAKSA